MEISNRNRLLSVPHTHIHTLQLLQHALFTAVSEESYQVFSMVSGKIQECKGEELELLDFKKICSSLTV